MSEFFTAVYEYWQPLIIANGCRGDFIGPFLIEDKIHKILNNYEFEFCSLDVVRLRNQEPNLNTPIPTVITEIEITRKYGLIKVLKGEGAFDT